MHYVFAKGHIAVNSASLTVVEAGREPGGSGRFEVELIPETLRLTRFADKAVGSALDIEIERQTQVFFDTVRDAIDEQLGPLMPAFDALLRQQGRSLAQPQRADQPVVARAPSRAACCTGRAGCSARRC
jgi:riboflavin synthase